MGFVWFYRPSSGWRWPSRGIPCAFSFLAWILSLDWILSHEFPENWLSSASHNVTSDGYFQGQSLAGFESREKMYTSTYPSKIPLIYRTKQKCLNKMSTIKKKIIPYKALYCLVCSCAIINPHEPPQWGLQWPRRPRNQSQADLKRLFPLHNSAGQRCETTTLVFI